MSTTATPTAGRTRIAVIGQLLGLSVLTNLVVLGIGSLAGASFAIDNAGTAMSVGPVEVIAASVIPLALAIIAHTLLSPRVALVRRLWTPVIAVVTLLSLGAMTGAGDLTTAISLGTMHLVVGGLAAFGIPARLGQ